MRSQDIASNIHINIGESLSPFLQKKKKMQLQLSFATLFHHLYVIKPHYNYNVATTNVIVAPLGMLSSHITS